MTGVQQSADVLVGIAALVLIASSVATYFCKEYQIGLDIRPTKAILHCTLRRPQLGDRTGSDTEGLRNKRETRSRNGGRAVVRVPLVCYAWFTT